MKHPFGDRWSATEDATLIAKYSVRGYRAAKRALRHRTVSSIFHRARRLGLVRCRPWTSADDATLISLWTGELTLRQIAKRLKRTLNTTYWRAGKLGLSRGCPPGFEYLTHAARRTGYGTQQLRHILGSVRPKVHIGRALARPVKRKRGATPGRDTFIMERADVDLAVKRWLKAAPLRVAAREAGVSGDVLATRLRLVGERKPVTGRKHWRVTDKQVKRALKGYTPRKVTPCRLCGAEHYARDLCLRHYRSEQRLVRLGRIRRAA